MNRMNDDAALLRRYAEEGSESAFAELVRGHVDLVYGAALRRTGGDPHRASEVAQEVFTALARHAGRLARETVLEAWLHTATRNAALKLMISEQRRRVRETRAFALETLAAAGEGQLDWERLRPLLDAAIDELPAADRAVVVLRFLERRAFAEIGRALRVSEDAARMRTERALEKLRAALRRRGITSTAALAAVVASQPLVAAPAGLAASLAAQALVASAGSGAVAAGLVTFMNTKLVLTAGVAAVVAFFVGNQFGPSRTEPVDATPVAKAAASAPAAAAASAALQSENSRLLSEVTGLSAEVARLKAANAELAMRRVPPPAPPADVTLGMEKWEVHQAALANLRQIDAARKEFVVKNGRTAGSVHDLVGRGGFIKTVRTVNGEDYAGLSMNPADPMTVKTPNGIEVTFDPTGATTTRPEIPKEVARVQELAPRLQAPINHAVNAYRAAHNGKNPPNDEALIPYFATPKDGADFVEFMEAKKAAGL